MEFNEIYKKFFTLPYDKNSLADLYDYTRNNYLNALGIDIDQFEKFIENADKLLRKIKRRGYGK